MILRNVVDFQHTIRRYTPMPEDQILHGRFLCFLLYVLNLNIPERKLSAPTIRIGQNQYSRLG
jgi:hypothetical protein